MKKIQPLSIWWISLLTVLASAPLAHAQAVRITEFMASNSRGLQDEDKEFSDWIELYNAGTNSVDLLNWALADNPANLSKWLFPSTNIAPGKFLIVFASNNQSRDVHAA